MKKERRGEKKPSENTVSTKDARADLETENPDDIIGAPWIQPHLKIILALEFSKL